MTYEELRILMLNQREQLRTLNRVIQRKRLWIKRSRALNNAIHQAMREVLTPLQLEQVTATAVKLMLAEETGWVDGQADGKVAE